ncbi:unnamed protein product [Rangifer tarandus platyrhynchus]|uniref:Uncharacterized protein n=2 Tax=Rangifer tarandus platyrhynchus TaxID=3082113 RepID=A0ABN8YVR2_RANTA|nr:unnamed protein product [Rangifer tarandus platyrhynchus]
MWTERVGGRREGQAGGPCLCLILAFPNSLYPPHLGTTVRGYRDHLEPGLNCLPLACSNSLHFGHFPQHDCNSRPWTCFQSLRPRPTSQASFVGLGWTFSPSAHLAYFLVPQTCYPLVPSHPINAASASLPPASSSLRPPLDPAVHPSSCGMPSPSPRVQSPA